MEDYSQISEELLAAFMEGKTNSAESCRIFDVIAKNSDIANLVNEANILDEIDAISLHDGDYGYWELGIDPVFTTEELAEIQTNYMPIAPLMYCKDEMSIMSSFSNVIDESCSDSFVVDYSGNNESLFQEDDPLSIHLEQLDEYSDINSDGDLCSDLNDDYLLDDDMLNDDFPID